MKRIIVLGTGFPQADLIQSCKNRGYYVIATSNAPGYRGEKLADEFHLIDITNAEAIKNLAEERKADLIYSVGSDVAMPTVGKVCEELHLPCPVSQQTAVLCNHKQLLREKLQKKKTVGNIPFQILEESGEPIHIPFPAIMKPSDSQGQRGVRRVDSVEEIRRHFQETISFSREKKVIVERFIDGSEISVNVFLENGQMKFYLISDRKVWDEYPGGIIHEHIIPSKYADDEKVSEKIKTLVHETLEAIELQDGPAYFQIKISNEGIPYLIEVTPRLDGCHMWRLIQYSTGVDLLEATLDLLEGKTYGQTGEYLVKPYSLEFLCEKPGAVFIRGKYEISEHEYLEWYYEDGQTVKRMNGFFEKGGYIIKRGIQL